MNHVMLGVDIGTTSTKSVLFEENGRIRAKAQVEYPLFTPDAATAEQDPEQIAEAVLRTMREAYAAGAAPGDKLLFVSFSSAMHSLIAVDAEGCPLTRCITWGDNRSAAWADRLKQDGTGLAIYRRTGTPIHPMSPLPKLMWLRETEPELFARSAKFISIKEYVFAKLFGVYVIDHSIASATGLMNLERLDWDEDALATAGVAHEQLSRLVPTTHVLTGLIPEMAAAAGLPEETPFVVGASDGVLSNLGVGAVKPGTVAATIGTSGAVRTVTDAPHTDPQGRTFCYALTERKWVIGGAVNNGGVLLRWMKEEFMASETETARRLGVDPYELLTRMAERVKPGSEGLLFHPYLTGERAPLWNANARGSFFGLTLSHKKEHLLRAVLEGVLYNLCAVLLAMEEMIPRTSRILATGGFARSAMWRQMMADVFGREVVVPESYESSCLGAVVLGLYAIGRIDSLDAVEAMVGATYSHHPESEAADVYRAILPLYMRLGRKLESEYEELAMLQRKLQSGAFG